MLHIYFPIKKANDKIDCMMLTSSRTANFGAVSNFVTNASEMTVMQLDRDVETLDYVK
jgi:hypothetical protein